jgi:hypothetical protein
MADDQHATGSPIETGYTRRASLRRCRLLNTRARSSSPFFGVNAIGATRWRAAPIRRGWHEDCGTPSVDQNGVSSPHVGRPR